MKPTAGKTYWVSAGCGPLGKHARRMRCVAVGLGEYHIFRGWLFHYEYNEVLVVARAE